MAGASLDIQVDDRDILAGLNALDANLEDFQPAFADMGEHLLLSHQQRWDQAQAPDGTPWEPLSADYAARKARKYPNAGILVGPGPQHLMDLHYNAGAAGLDFGSDKIHAATHQFGADDRNIPARPYLGISADDEAELLAIAEEHLSTL